MGEALRAASSIANPYSAICFVAVLGTWIAFRYFKHKEKRLEALAQPDRAKDRDDWLAKAGYSLEKTTGKQSHEIAMAKLSQERVKAKGNTDTLRIAIFVAAGLFIAVLVWSVFYYEKPAPPKVAFLKDSSFNANSPQIPDDLFGSPQDSTGAPRLWMRLLQGGASEIGGWPVEDTKGVWVWTEIFEEKYKNFTAHIYTGTTKKVVAVAFLVEPGNPPKASLLRKSAIPNQSKDLILFDVPLSTKHSRLIVFLTMRNESFSDIESIHIRSTPTETPT